MTGGFAFLIAIMIASIIGIIFYTSKDKTINYLTAPVTIISFYAVYLLTSISFKLANILNILEKILEKLQ